MEAKARRDVVIVGRLVVISSVILLASIIAFYLGSLGIIKPYSEFGFYFLTCIISICSFAVGASAFLYWFDLQ